MTRARLIDVSEVQGHIDMTKIVADGFDGVILKCTEGGGYVDPRFHESAVAARAVGLVLGAYHFLTPSAPVAAQVSTFVDTLAKSPLVDFVVIDFEFPTPEHWSNGGTTLAPRALECARGVRDGTGLPVLIYEYPYFDNSLPPSAELVALVAEFDLWIASYLDEKHWPADTDRPAVPKHWLAKGWRFWQTSGNGSLPVNGLSGVADHDVYNGTIADLRAWLGSIDNPYAAHEEGASDTAVGPAA